MLQESLAEAGYHVSGAASAEESVPMDGFTVIKRLQPDAQLLHISMIVLTAKTLTAVERAVLDQCVRTVLHKRGLDRDALIRELCELLQAYRDPSAKR